MIRRSCRAGVNQVVSEEMKHPLSPRMRGALTLEITRGATFGARQDTALRDVREAVSLWRLCWTLAALDIKIRYRGSVLVLFG